MASITGQSEEAPRRYSTTTGAVRGDREGKEQERRVCNDRGRKTTEGSERQMEAETELPVAGVAYTLLQGNRWGGAGPTRAHLYSAPVHWNMGLVFIQRAPAHSCCSESDQEYKLSYSRT